MQFWKLKFVLVVLVFSFDHIRSAPQSAGADDGVADDGVADADDGVADADDGVADADDGVADADDGVADADDGVADADQGVDDADQGVDDADQGVDDADEGVDDAVKGAETAVKEMHTSGNGKMTEAIAAQCKPGKYFYTDGCNICYCYGEGTQGCTDIFCGKKQTLLSSSSKLSATNKKLRDKATGCVPGEKIEYNGCKCNCVIPSVMTCEKTCVA